jgi:hypothetical protein
MITTAAATATTTICVFPISLFIMVVLELVVDADVTPTTLHCSRVLIGTVPVLVFGNVRHAYVLSQIQTNTKVIG